MKKLIRQMISLMSALLILISVIPIHATATEAAAVPEATPVPENETIESPDTYKGPEPISDLRFTSKIVSYDEHNKPRVENISSVTTSSKSLWYNDGDLARNVVRSTLDRYFKEYTFDITTCKNYDADSGCVVVPIASGFGGDRDVRMVEKQFDQTIGTFTIDFHQKLYNDERPDTEVYQRKVYTVEFYDGGLYYLSAEVVPVNG